MLWRQPRGAIAAGPFHPIGSFSMTTLTAEVISIGDEMTSGARLDTNSPWLCQRLGELGVMPRFQTMVGDSLDDNVEVFRNAISRADIVIATGGLGPTADDLTRDALAIVAGRPLVLHPESLAHIEALFASRARPMPPRNRVQAMLPEGAFDIFNPKGTAPGIDVTISSAGARSSRVFALPGVPAEMKEMFVATVAPRIEAELIARGGGRRVIRQAIVKCFGVGESDMEAMLGNMIARDRVPRVGITVSAATISLRITAEGDDATRCQELIESTRREIVERAGEYVFGEGEDFELHHAVAEILESRGERLATIETGHGSVLAGWLSGVAPRHVYAGGEVVERLGGGEKELRERLVRSDADWLLSVGDYPDLGGDGDGLGKVRIALCGRGADRYWEATQTIGGHPSIVHPRIGKTGLAFARARLLGLAPARQPGLAGGE
jgi:nicotinamide-nucleotide amidase